MEFPSPETISLLCKRTVQPLLACSRACVSDQSIWRLSCFSLICSPIGIRVSLSLSFSLFFSVCDCELLNLGPEFYDAHPISPRESLEKEKCFLSFLLLFLYPRSVMSVSLSRLHERPVSRELLVQSNSISNSGCDLFLSLLTIHRLLLIYFPSSLILISCDSLFFFSLLVL